MEVGSQDIKKVWLFFTCFETAKNIEKSWKASSWTRIFCLKLDPFNESHLSYWSRTKSTCHHQHSFLGIFVSIHTCVNHNNTFFINSLIIVSGGIFCGVFFRKKGKAKSGLDRVDPSKVPFSDGSIIIKWIWVTISGQFFAAATPQPLCEAVFFQTRILGDDDWQMMCLCAGGYSLLDENSLRQRECMYGGYILKIRVAYALTLL